MHAAADITYVNGWPAAAADGQFEIFRFNASLGWGFTDRANRWHAAPQHYRDVLEHYHPQGSGLPGLLWTNDAAIDAATMPCVPIAEFDIADLHIADFDEVIIGPERRDTAAAPADTHGDQSPAPEDTVRDRPGIPVPAAAATIGIDDAIARIRIPHLTFTLARLP